MLIREFRVIMPVSVAEYQIGQLYTVAEASKQETGGGEGVEVLINEPYEKDGQKGQYTHKKYFLEHKVNAFIRMIAPKNALILDEKAWNAYPICKTVLTNQWMKQDFELTIETIHKADRGETENIHNLTPEELAKREVVMIDIANDHYPKNWPDNENPTKFKSEKTQRGPLGPDWIKTHEPVMCCYKLVRIHFKMLAVGGRVEHTVQNSERDLFTKFHRQVFCSIDSWVDLTMEDIRRIEAETKEALDKQRNEGEKRSRLGDHPDGHAHGQDSK